MGSIVFWSENMNNITGCGWFVLLSPIAIVVGWIYLPGLSFVGLVILVIIIGYIAGYFQSKEQSIPKIEISDPRTADASDFSSDTPWDLLHKSCLVINYNGSAVNMDSSFLRSVLTQFQSDGCCMHAGNYLSKKRLAKIDEFFDLGGISDGGYYINTKMNTDSIREIVKGYELWGGWHEWVFGLYNSNTRPRVESKEFRKKFSVDNYPQVFSEFDTVVYCNLDMSWGMLIIVNPDRFDEGIEYARSHLGYEAEK